MSGQHHPLVVLVVLASICCRLCQRQPLVVFKLRAFSVFGSGVTTFRPSLAMPCVRGHHPGAQWKPSLTARHCMYLNFVLWLKIGCRQGFNYMWISGSLGTNWGSLEPLCKVFWALCKDHLLAKFDCPTPHVLEMRCPTENLVSF